MPLLLSSKTQIDTALGASDLIGLFSDSAQRFPARVALSDGEAELTYRELDAWSGAVARHLRERGVRHGDRVALRMTADTAAIVAILGILKCGAAYVPLDLRHPAERKSFILADCAATVLVGEPGQGDLGRVRDVVSPADLARLRGERTGPDELPGPGPQDTAYVIYTSGTTGRPKGVPVRHRHVAALFAGARAVLDFAEDDRWLLFHSLAFDFSVWEIWGPLTSGACLVVLPTWAARNPGHCLDVLVDKRVTVLNQTPTAFAVLASSVINSDRDLPDLRYVIFGGEKVTGALLRPWAKKYGLERPALINGYGITETTVFTTFHEITDQDLEREESYIGSAIAGFAVRIVDEAGHDVPDGETGELWLAGPQVADGYLGRPELTAEKFVPAADPATGEHRVYYRSGDLVARAANGELVYTGRADLQVKLRGYRIELSDIEAAVRGHEPVSDAVVLVHEFKPGDQRLVCAYTAREGADPDPSALQRHVKELLPSYMYPARYLRLETMPRTVNGKADRAAVARIWDEQRGAL
jgi:amino acid adenylation domain-containing protein